VIVPLPEMLREAGKRNAAVLAPDFFSRHMLELELDIAEAHQAPIIASYPALALDSFRRYRHWVAGLRLLCEKARVPVCLHLDHGKNVQVCLRAIDAGFASVMIDGSALPLAENVRMTKSVVAAAHAKGVAVEGEIGHVGAASASIESRPGAGMLTDPHQARFFAEQTGVDCLAVSIGTAHGVYTFEPRIDFERLAQIRDQVPVPLVLHGSSCTGDENIARAVKLGIRKVNLFTEFFRPYVAETIAFYKHNPLRLVYSSHKAIRQKVVIEPILLRYFRLIGSVVAE